MKLSSSFSLLALATLQVLLYKASAYDIMSTLEIQNQSAKPVSIHWIDPETKEPTPVSAGGPGEILRLDSWVGHEFNIIIEEPDQKSEECTPETCTILHFTISEPNYQMAILTKDFKIIAEEQVRDDDMPEDVVRYCQELAEEMYKEEEDAENRKKIVQEFGECLKTGMMPKIRKLREEYHFHNDVRRTIASNMEAFTCTNPNLESSPDVRLEEWISERDQISRPVHVKLDRPASKIHVVQNFAKPEECREIETGAETNLYDATVADGKGGTRKSNHRKAKQAGVTPSFVEGDLISALSRRVYDYTNHVLGLNITEHGQEPLMSIQYFGRGYDDNEPDRYQPHCDGQCEGQTHRYGTRIATMVIYCTVPELGGHTNFQDSAVHVKPEAFSAVFFSYMDPVTNKMDAGLTRHSGCPVYEGEKKIVTQWVRYGVDGNERHYNNFNSLGILWSEAAENK